MNFGFLYASLRLRRRALPDSSLLKTSRRLAWLRRSELESRGRYEDLFQHATDCVVIFDEAEQIVDVNPAAERSLGFSRNEMLGESLSMIIPCGVSSLKARAARR